MTADLAEYRAGLLARCTFPPPGAEVTCAVSGGADSSALLVLAVAAGLRATAVHVDHGTRPESAAERGVVEALARSLGAAFESRQVEVPPGSDYEGRARRARWGVLPPGTLTGHTADDQAETILLAMLRGAGADGLSGMGSDGHPLLGLRRHETTELCRRVGHVPVDDPGNRDPSHRRVRVRHELLPLLADISDRDPVPVLVRQGALFRDEATLLDELAAGIDVTDGAALGAAPPALARRAVRRWLGTTPPPDAAAVARVLEVATGSRRATEVGGRRVVRTGGRLRLE